MRMLKLVTYWINAGWLISSIVLIIINTIEPDIKLSASRILGMLIISSALSVVALFKDATSFI